MPNWKELGKKAAQALESSGAKKALEPTNLGNTTEVSAKQSRFSRALELLGKPQKYASDKLAEAAGLKQESTSEQNFANIADAAGDALGVPRDSATGNAVKALGVGAAEIFLDPTNVIPFGKIARVAGKSIKGLKELPALGHIAEKASKLKSEVVGTIGKEKLLADYIARTAEQIRAAQKAAAAPAPGIIVTEKSSQATDTYKKLAKAAEESKSSAGPKVSKAQEEGPTLDYKQLIQEYRDKARK